MILPIYVYGSDVLRAKSKEVDIENVDREVFGKFVDDMFETMKNADGVGLAAPQVGKDIQCVMVDGRDIADSYHYLKDFVRVMINPVVLEESEETSTYSEGCLSIPDINCDVIRPKRIKVEYYDRDFVKHVEEFDDFAAGVKAVLTGAEPAVSFQEAGQLLDKYFAEIEAEQKAEAAAMGAALREEGEAFLKFNADQEGVVVLPSGLQYKVLAEGQGKKPKATDKVKCHYAGTLLNGVQFDSSYDRGEPAVFGLNQVIAGWTEGVQLMSEGSKYEFYIPYNLAYGEHGAPGAIPPYATLKFVVELLEVL